MSNMSSSLTITTYITFGILFVLYKIVQSERVKSARPLKLPPGPRGRPLIGNLLDLPNQHLWIQADEWARQYGDVVHLNLFDQHLIFLNTEEAAIDLLEKRSVTYSDRAPFTALNKLMGADFNLGFMPYGDRWRTTRRVFLEGFRKKDVQTYEKTRERRTRILLRQLFMEPDAFYDHLIHFASSNILEAVYGIDVDGSEKFLLGVTERALDGINVAAATGVFSLMEHFPLLRYWPANAPGGGFKRKTLIWKEDIQKMNDVPFGTAVNLIRANSSGPMSFVARWLRRISSDGYTNQLNQEYIKDAAGNAFVAGVETTASSLQTLFLAMMLYPEVQAKAHEELDRVIGRDRLPKSSDEEQLPYLKAIYKELLRWHPVVPLGIPHQTVRDDEYRGFLIPKGSLVIGNGWSMLRNEITYGSDTDDFKPERFLQEESKDPTVAFGFGRRICPGRYFAEHALFLTIASILMLYRIDKPSEMEGSPDRKDYKFSSTLTVHPEPFKCSITPRYDTNWRL